MKIMTFICFGWEKKEKILPLREFDFKKKSKFFRLISWLAVCPRVLWFHILFLFCFGFAWWYNYHSMIVSFFLFCFLFFCFLFLFVAELNLLCPETPVSLFLYIVDDWWKYLLSPSVPGWNFNKTEIMDHIFCLLSLSCFLKNTIIITNHMCQVSCV